MKLFEYQAKELFEQIQIPVPNRTFIEDYDEMGEVIGQIGFPCVLKAQVLQGGRGKQDLSNLYPIWKKRRAKEKRFFQKPIICPAF
ncbi:ATP-grasp domain-containing protein [Neobacillus sp. 19]